MPLQRKVSSKFLGKSFFFKEICKYMYIHMYSSHMWEQNYTHGYGGIWCPSASIDLTKLVTKLLVKFTLSTQCSISSPTLGANQSAGPDCCIRMGLSHLCQRSFIFLFPYSIISTSLLWIAHFYFLLLSPLHISFCFHLFLHTSAHFSLIFTQPTLKILFFVSSFPELFSPLLLPFGSNWVIKGWIQKSGNILFPGEYIHPFTLQTDNM